MAGVPKKTENKNLVELFDNNFIIIYQTVCIQPQHMSRNLREGRCERFEINGKVPLAVGMDTGDRKDDLCYYINHLLSFI